MTAPVETRPNWKNRTLWTGDNLDVLRGMNSECVDLIYLDPPFNSNADYAAPIGSKAVGAAFKDTWTLNDVDLAWHGEIAEREPALYAIISAAGLSHGKGMMSYLMMIAVRMLELRRVLKPAGTLYLHCDDAANGYLRTCLDAIMGSGNFRNEIHWQRAAGRAKGSQHKAKRFGRDSDCILFYVKSHQSDKRFNPPHKPLTAEETKTKFPLVDERGNYNVDVPLFRQPSMGARPNLCYEYKGVRNPHPSGWRVSNNKLKKMDEQRLIVWREGKRPLRKTYASTYKGIPIGSMWTDIPNVTGTAERTGYPTQKPLALLRRIIEASSQEGDVVLDPFCGCATALVAAEELNRQWAGIDLSDMAAKLMVSRLEQVSGTLWGGKIHHRRDLPRRTDQGKLPNYSTHKHTLYGKQEGLCAGCETHFAFRNFTVDHIVPQARGGSDHLDNLQLLCGACNSTKGKGTQAELKAKLKQQGIIQ